LKAFEKMGGRQRKFTWEKSTGQSSPTTTATNKDFGPQLQRNHVVFTSIDAQAADNSDEVRELLNQQRGSEPPDQLNYRRYLVNTEGFINEATIQQSAYPLLTNQTLAEREISGYKQNVNYAWSAIDNHLTTGLSDAKLDVFESYCTTDYPPQAVNTLASGLAPTSYNIAMPAFAVECKGCDSGIAKAELQCAYDGALMTEGARVVHTHMGKSDDDFTAKHRRLQSHTMVTL
jgi:hypothetical protein